jgi:hypothetical protein
VQKPYQADVDWFFEPCFGCITFPHNQLISRPVAIDRGFVELPR